MRTFAFPTLAAARRYLAAERALSAREHRRGNVVYDGGFECLRDTQVPLVDAARLRRVDVEAAARIGGGL